MRTLPAGMAAKITAGDFTGSNKATTRVTIQKVQLRITQAGTQVYSSVNFVNSTDGARELPNIKSVNWERSAGNAAGSLTMELFNTTPLPPGTGPDVGDQFDLLGYYTYNRGRTSYSQSNWGHVANSWQDFLVPDRLVRIYQGYGADYNVLPENDPNLLLMGVFLLDDVTYTADGLITVEGRDVTRLLYDQIMFPSVVPLVHYPLAFESYRQVETEPITSVTWRGMGLEGSSNGLAGSATETQFGHHPSDAFDPDEQSYWLSTGYNEPDASHSFVWIQGSWDGSPLYATKISVRGGPYRCYVSWWVDGAWEGTATIPYTPGASGEAARDKFARIPYVEDFTIQNGEDFVMIFGHGPSGNKAGITKMRYTFTKLHDSKHSPEPFRAAVRDLRVTEAITTTTGTETQGNYGDYSEIVKRLLAYGGFYWPQNGKQVLTGTNTRTYSFATPDPYLSDGGVSGRVWGDVQMSGTSGPAPLGIEVWDKKPLIDGVNYVKDVLGFVFYGDEVGGAIFRSPNTFKLGNWLVDVDGVNAVRTTSFVSIHDHEAILGLRAKLSSRNLREHVFVANVDGQQGAIVEGIIEHPSGFRRVAGWTDQNFATERECKVMAELIALRQMFTYRQNSLRIPANPAIQIDDQVMIYERTTSDAYFHHVSAISSSWDLASGKWIYDLTTSWLGQNPTGEWAVPVSSLSQETRDYLTALGQI